MVSGGGRECNVFGGAVGECVVVSVVEVDAGGSLCGGLTFFFLVSYGKDFALICVGFIKGIKKMVLGTMGLHCFDQFHVFCSI